MAMTRVVLETDVEMRTRDGVVLRSDVYRPDDDEPHPVLLLRTPYDKAALRTLSHIDPRVAAARGYVAILQDVRGRFASDGEWLPWHHETDDGHDAVAWASTQPWSTGWVGMWGASYFGNTQWRAAVSGAPSLRAIAPGTTWSDPLDGLLERGGVPELGLNAAWSIGATGVPHLVRGGQTAAAMTAVEHYDRLADDGYADVASNEFPLLVEHGVPDIGWRRWKDDPSTVEECTVSVRDSTITTPALHLGGWYDIFLQGTLDNFTAQRAMGVPSRLVVGPWSHEAARSAQVGAINFGLAADGTSLFLRSNITDLHLSFFDDVRAGVAAPAAPVTLFVMGANVWRDEPAWPLERAVDTDLHLAADGLLTEDLGRERGRPVLFEHDGSAPVPTIGGALVMHGAYPPGAFDQSGLNDRGDLLSWSSAPLEQPCEITGRVTARLRVESSAPVSDWVVRLCDVRPDGRWINITDGVLRVHQPENTIHDIEVDLWSTCIQLGPGHRVGLQVAASSFPRWSPVPDGPATSTRKVHLDGSSLVRLPVVPS